MLGAIREWLAIRRWRRLPLRGKLLALHFGRG
jgi:hypothetical protein